MKITSISKLFCAVALCVSLTSFRGVSQEEGKESNDVKSSAMSASVIQSGKNGNKVKLAVDKGTDQSMSIFLKDRSGKIYDRELFSKNEDKYRRIFNLTDMRDGSYYFELYYKDQKLTKEVQLETTVTRAISLQ